MTVLPILDGKTKKIYLDGGLPRHIVLDGKVLKEFHTRWDFSKDTALRGKDGKIVPGAGSLTAMEVPEEGTPVEIAAMKEHAIRTRPTAQPNGEPGNFILNGLPPTNGAPFADPAVNDHGDANVHRRRYQAAVFQVDTILNKKGWHYPQQRMISLWQDVAPTMENAPAGSRSSSAPIRRIPSSSGTRTCCRATMSWTISKCVRRRISSGNISIW